MMLTRKAETYAKSSRASDLGADGRAPVNFYRLPLRLVGTGAMVNLQVCYSRVVI